MAETLELTLDTEPPPEIELTKPLDDELWYKAKKFILTGRIDGADILVADLRRLVNIDCEDIENDRSTYWDDDGTETVAMIKAPSWTLPRITVWPKCRFAERLLKRKTYRVHNPYFEDKFTITGESQEAACETITGKVQEHLMDRPDMSVEFGGDTIIVSYTGGKAGIAKIPALLETALFVAQEVRKSAPA